MTDQDLAGVEDPLRFEYCFPGSEKIKREVEHDGETLRVPVRRIHVSGEPGHIDLDDTSGPEDIDVMVQRLKLDLTDEEAAACVRASVCSRRARCGSRRAAPRRNARHRPRPLARRCAHTALITPFAPFVVVAARRPPPPPGTWRRRSTPR